jgi:monoamine oxidase
MQLSNNKVFSTQTVIVGSSLSGLISAYELGKKDIQVLILERDIDFGGHSRSDIAGINLVNTTAQQVRGMVCMCVDHIHHLCYSV